MRQKLADEKAQIELSREIEVLFRDNVMQSGKANKLIMAARILRTDMDTLLEISGGGTDHRALSAGYGRGLNDLDDLMKENGMLRNTLKSLGEKAKALSDQVTPNVNKLGYKLLWPIMTVLFPKQ
ncbi:MAG: hypothetical protein MZV70_74365 [Desulfobacterales bacterium]|nr:hypothetical protein [Desulfobacterales bacterium]